MKQLKYAIQNVIRGKGSNIVKVVSMIIFTRTINTYMW